MPGADILESILASIDEISGKDQLQKIITAAQARLTGIMKQERKEVARQIAALAASAGLEVEIREISAGGKKPKSSKKSSPTAFPPKYRNPANPAETWNGKGRHPKWFDDALARGVAEEEMEIAA